MKRSELVDALIILIKNRKDVLGDSMTIGILGLKDIVQYIEILEKDLHHLELLSKAERNIILNLQDDNKKLKGAIEFLDHMKK